jgi:hypothetical protein
MDMTKAFNGVFQNIWVHDICFMQKDLRKKLDPKSVKTISMGYNFTSKAYKLWHPLKK